MNNLTGSVGCTSALLESPVSEGAAGQSPRLDFYVTVTTACGFRTFSFVPEKTRWEEQMGFFFWGPCFQDAFLFVCHLCVLLHEIHALL